MYDKLNRRHIFTETQSDLASSKDSFPENISDVAKYKLLGNAVTIPVARTMADFVFECLKSLDN